MDTVKKTPQPPGWGSCGVLSVIKRINAFLADFCEDLLLQLYAEQSEHHVVSEKQSMEGSGAPFFES
jgi:hypothetical protein